MPRTAIRSWNRLEPQARSRDMRRSLAAEVRDPLWLLTRQWQLGEFRGEDAASPRSVVVEMETVGFDAFEGDAEDFSTRPLDRRLAEPMVVDLDVRLALADEFLSMARDELDVDALRTAFPLPPPSAFDDAESQRLARTMAPRLFDGYAVVQAVADGTPIPGGSAVRQLATQLAEFAEAVYGPLVETPLDPPGWRQEELRADVRLRAGGVQFAATFDGAPAWDALRIEDDGPLGGTIETIEQQPTQVRFPGMPNNRFWDFEEGQVHLAGMRPDLRDIGSMALMEFALLHGSDWFVLDLDQPIGTVRRLRSVVVRDVFGDETRIEAAGASGGSPWSMFQIASPAGSAPYVALLPSTTDPAAGKAVEEVAFGRDEIANLAWAIEKVVPNGLGEPWPGAERDGQSAAAAPRPVSDQDLVYQAMSEVPPSWTPLLPRRLGDDEQVTLVAGRVAGDRPGPQGVLLRPQPQPFAIDEQEVPRAGLVVRRAPTRARWLHGSAHLWVQRSVRAGQGGTSAGLAFDQAQTPQSKNEDPDG